jgi:Protein kinase domain
VVVGEGTVLGGYVLEEEIGSGASSVVFRARHRRLGRSAAVKVLAAPRDGVWRERFLKESRVAASIDHPNVIPVYDAGEDGSTLYIVMRLVEGTDLRALVAEGPLPLGLTVKVVAQIAAALDAAHARGLVHRDVKPANILIEAGDHVYLSDFGVAKDGDAGFTRTGGFVGSVEYSAPEQIEGRVQDGRSDLYSLACVAYECLAGAPPFHRPSEVAVLHAHLHDPAPDVRTGRPELPEQVADVLRRGLSRKPDERFQDGASFAAALERAARARRPRARVSRGRAAALALLAVLVGGGGALAGYLVAPSATHTVVTVQQTVRVADAHALADAAYAQLQAKNYARAAVYARRALPGVARLPKTDPYRGYVNYDLGIALVRLGRCSEALPYLHTASRLEHGDQKVRAALTLAARC